MILGSATGPATAPRNEPFAVTLTVSRFTPEPPVRVKVLVDLVRVPRGAGEAHEINA